MKTKKSLNEEIRKIAVDKFLKDYVLEFYPKLIESESIFLDGIGLSNLIVHTFKKSFDLKHSYDLITAYHNLVDLDHLKKSNNKLFEIIKDYINEKYDIYTYIDLVFIHYLDVKLNLNKFKEYNQTIKSILNFLSNDIYKYVDIFYHPEAVIFSSLLCILDTIEDINLRMKYKTKLIELFFVKFDVWFDFQSLKAYEQEQGLIILKEVVPILHSYSMNETNLSVENYKKILTHFDNFSGIKFHKAYLTTYDEYEFIKSVSKIKLDIITKIELEFNYISNGLTKNQIIELLNSNQHLLEEEKWKRLYIDTYEDIINDYTGNISYLNDELTTLKDTREIIIEDAVAININEETINNAMDVISALLEHIEAFDDEDGTSYLLKSDEETLEMLQLFFPFINFTHLFLQSAIDDLYLAQSIDSEELIVGFLAVNDGISKIIYLNDVFTYDTFSYKKYSLYESLQADIVEIQEEVKDVYISVEAEYNFTRFSKLEVKEHVIGLLENISTSRYYRSFAKNTLSKEEIIKKIELLNNDRYKWFDSLLQADYLIQYYSHNNSQGLHDWSTDWTFIYSLLIKSFENLYANFLEYAKTNIRDLNGKTIHIHKYSKEIYINLDARDWRKSLTMSDLQQIFSHDISQYYKDSYDTDLLNSRINNLFRQERNMYIHHKHMYKFGELETLFDQTFALICSILSLV